MKSGLMMIAGGLLVAGCAKAPGNTTNESVATTVAATPDLKGKWVGTSQSIVLGATKHHAPATGPQPLLDNVEFTTVITGQDGQRFWGTLDSKQSKDAITGVIERDGTSILARTSEGEIRGKLVDADTIDITYSAGGDATVLAVNSWKRQK